MNTVSEELLPFFVYGTLRAEEHNAKRLHRFATSVRPARLQGCVMFDLGPYPMIIESSDVETLVSPVLVVDVENVWVYGEVVEVESKHYVQTLRSLDQLESVDPKNIASRKTPYRRVACHIQLESGDMLKAWAYLGRKDLALRGRFVRGGDWKHRFEKEEGEEGERA